MVMWPMTSRDPQRCCEAVRSAILATAWLKLLSHVIMANKWLIDWFIDLFRLAIHWLFVSWGGPLYLFQHSIVKKHHNKRGKDARFWISWVFSMFLPNIIKIDPYNFELYRFNVGAFFESQCISLASVLCVRLRLPLMRLCITASYLCLCNSV